MAAAPSLAQATANAMANAITTYMGNAGKIIIYSGTAPANADAALSGNTVLATFTGGSPVFGSASGGTITLSGVPLTVAASATGTATFFRLYKTDGTTPVFQGTVGTASADLILNTVALTSGVNVTITAGTINMPT